MHERLPDVSPTDIAPRLGPLAWVGMQDIDLPVTVAEPGYRRELHQVMVDVSGDAESLGLLALIDCVGQAVGTSVQTAFKRTDEQAHVQERHDHGHHAHDHGHDHHHDVNRHDDHIRAFCFQADEPIPEEVLTNWLDVLMGFVGSNILRGKGILNVEGQPQPIVVHGKPPTSRSGASPD